MCRPFQYVAILDIGCAGVLTLSDVWCMYGHVADLDYRHVRAQEDQ